ncbi:MAG: hypothetical protein DDT40_00240 [candidate division WS2 bacterium]|uniref:Uncharacterized protein n=1 Tax=Psychracetigena formicireducens TaxID=2986056 RepID=A0A9E2BF26_PSYF1|nr:hypothetical protein [Candidatus Psychracetigena formicireducens]MBT9144436.1 hypothetical protein [Candidatus Psychracetigena formicireducens]MBT9150074.1 hypothetical protein [Candidatus Psychracetigena formicireducens]
MIDSYSFGQIIIKGKRYEKDLLILGEMIHPNWWRKSGHHLTLEDIGEVLLFSPEVLIVGTGALGRMIISPEVKEFCLEEKIDLQVLTTGEAIKVFNILINQKKIAGLFHLTC